jgi:polyvinyl alcohol dehydrogenase (cytochrome)
MAMAVIAGACAPAAALAQVVTQGVDHSEGQAVYRDFCAACHDKPDETKSPALESLQQMGLRAISHALTDGKMRLQGAALAPRQIDAVVAWLAADAQPDTNWAAERACPADRTPVDTGVAIVGGFGLGLENRRNMSADLAGLTKQQIETLAPAWVLGFPQTANMRAQPAIVGNTMFLPIADSGQLFALDTGGAAPCVKWVYQHGLPLRTHVQYGEVDGRAVLVMGDGAAHIQMIDAANGELVWRTSVRVTSVSNTTGMPVLHDGRVYAPVSSGELNMGAAEDYECCTSHGAVVALDARSGEIDWVYHTMEAAKPTRMNAAGTQLWGPSGAPIWTTPAIDEERGVLYVGTGQNTSEPPTDTSDAVLAIDLETGQLRWKFQATANDVFLTGCMFDPAGLNCPPEYSVNGDYDFGASMVLAERPDGSSIVLAPQKNGMLWALDPDNAGELLWSVKVGPGGPAGGIHWGVATDGERAYAAINKTGLTAVNAAGVPFEEAGEPGLHAVDLDTGEIVWSWFNAADCSGGRQERIPTCGANYGLSAATLLVDGAVIQGANDGYVRAFDAETGALLYAYDTAREFETVNGVPARGGSIDNASVIAANGTLYVQSGYGLLGAAGNALIALKP